MTLQDQMNGVLDATPGIGVLAYGDLSSGLILKSASTAPCPREVLDLLGERAATSFSRLFPELLVRTAQTSGSPASIIHFTERNAQIFARSLANPEDVVCAVCDPGADLQPLLLAVQVLADRVAGPE
jgi:hypothetical protein